MMIIFVGFFVLFSGENFWLVFVSYSGAYT